MPEKPLNIEEVLKHLDDIKTVPHYDKDGVNVLLEGYGRRAIADQVRVRKKRAESEGANVTPEMESRLWKEAEMEIIPQLEDVKKAATAVPYDVLKNVMPVVMAQASHPANLSGQFAGQRGFSGRNGVASVLLGGSGVERRHSYDPGETFIHEIAHANDYTKTSLSGESSVDTDINFTNRVLDMYSRGLNMSEAERYRQSPSEAYANFMMEKYKAGELSEENFHELAKKAAKHARLVEEFYRGSGL